MPFLILMLLTGLVAGSGITLTVLMEMRRRLSKEKKAYSEQAAMVNEKLRSMKEKALAFDQEMKAREEKVKSQADQLQAEEKQFEARFVSYQELQSENALLKRDLLNLNVNLRKVTLDRELQGTEQQTIKQRVTELGGRYLKENVKWIGSSLTANNFAACKERLLDVIERCRGIGFEVPDEQEESLLAALKTEFEKMVRAAFEREEQARIKAQIREEQRLQKEVDRELEQLERERAAIKAALEKALAEAKDQNNEEVQRLKARLAEAEEKSQRAISRAQMTKAGYVYVISNIGSFGENIFKVGMTRRLEPNDRVRELSSASVPFPYDVHMMISADNAPELENALHRSLYKNRINKANPRKEFFRADIETLKKIVQENHGEVEYVVSPEALEYHQSLTMSDEDAEYIQSVYANMGDEGETPDIDV